jgi:transposase
VLYLSKNAREIQIRALNDQLASRLQELHDWQSALLNHESRRDSDTTAVNIRIQRIIGGSPFIRDILSVSYDHTKPHEKRLSFSVNEEKKAEIIQNSFGRRILFTNRHDWNTLDIINTYFSQATVEQSFRDLKDDRSIAIRPQFHWTDHSIVIHVFTCYLALLLSRLLVIRAREVIPDISIHGCLTLLREIRLALLISKNQRKNICSWKLENSSVNALLLFNHLIAKH